MTEHSKNFYKVKSYYDSGKWKEPRVREAVIKEWITEQEFEEIVGKPFNN